MKIRIKIKKTFSLTKNVTQSHSIHNWCDILKKKQKTQLLISPYFTIIHINLGYKHIFFKAYFLLQINNRKKI